MKKYTPKECCPKKRQKINLILVIVDFYQRFKTQNKAKAIEQKQTKLVICNRHFTLDTRLSV